MIVFLLRKRYLVIGLGILLAAAMFLAACLPEVLASAAAEEALQTVETEEVPAEDFSA